MPRISQKKILELQVQEFAQYRTALALCRLLTDSPDSEEEELDQVILLHSALLNAKRYLNPRLHKTVNRDRFNDLLYSTSDTQ